MKPEIAHQHWRAPLRNGLHAPPAPASDADSLVGAFLLQAELRRPGAIRSLARVSASMLTAAEQRRMPSRLSALQGRSGAWRREQQHRQQGPYDSSQISQVWLLVIAILLHETHLAVTGGSKLL